MNSPEPRQIPDSDFAKKWRQIRACARCHRLKMKCSYDDPSYSSCKRCFTAGVQCSPDHDPTSKNKVSRPRKKTKVAGIPDFKQLNEFLKKQQHGGTAVVLRTEDEIQAMQDQVATLNGLKLQLTNYISQINNLVEQKEALISGTAAAAQAEKGAASQIQLSPHGGQQLPLGTEISTNGVPLQVRQPHVPQGFVSPQSLPIISFEKNLVHELVKLDYLTMEFVAEKYEFFRNELLIYWPVIKLPDFYTVEYLTKNKPLLLLTFVVTCCVTTNDLALYNVLSYYLDINLSHKLFVNGNLSIDIIQCYLILSIWNPPPKKWGTFKHQLHLLTSLNLNLVVDLGNKCESMLLNTDYLNGNYNLMFSENETIRLFLMIYASCGSLGLSLPKFKLVQWSSSHMLACNYLKSQFDPVDRTNTFIYFLSILISIGQELMSKLETEISSDDPSQISALVYSYEEKLLQLMMNYRMTDPNSQSKENPLVGLTYQQILVTMYDHLIYRTLSSSLILYIKQLFSNTAHTSANVYALSITVLEKLISSCKRLIDNFLNISNKTLYIPTFFNYRPMNALISLVKAKILIKLLLFELNEETKKSMRNPVVDPSYHVSKIMQDVSNLDFNLKNFFSYFYKNYELYARNSRVYEKMFTIVKKMKKLIKLVDSILNKKSGKNGSKKPENLTENVAGFKFNLADATDDSENGRQENSLVVTSNLANNDLLNLLYDLGKEKAVENIEMFELSEEHKRKRKQLKRKAAKEAGQVPKSLKIETTDPATAETAQAPPMDGTAGSETVDAENEDVLEFDQKTNLLMKELFSDNVFSDIISDDLSFFVNMDLGFGKPEAAGNAHNINQFLESETNRTPVNMEAVGVESPQDGSEGIKRVNKMIPSSSFGSSIEEYNDNFWMNKENSVEPSLY